jgi:hypothetical protein
MTLASRQPSNKSRSRPHRSVQAIGKWASGALLRGRNLYFILWAHCANCGRTCPRDGVNVQWWASEEGRARGDCRWPSVADSREASLQPAMLLARMCV